MDDNQKQQYTSNRRSKKGPSTFKLIVLALVFSLIGAVIGGAVVGSIAQDRFGQGVPGAGSDRREITIEPSGDTSVGAAVAAKNLDSVVGISTTTRMRDLLNRTFDSEAIGSGWIAHEDGYIVTNDHVVASLSSRSGYSSGGGYADDISVVFNNGEQVPAEVLWSDSNLDLAILKIEPTRDLTVAEIGNSDDLSIGDQVFAIGNPLALDFHGSFTGGYVSGLDRTITTPQINMSDLIQTDAAINSGNSGGPLFNTQGQVVGINTAKVQSAEGLGFSISVNTLKPILEGVIKDGDFQKVTLGIYTMDLNTYENYLGQEMEGIESGVVVAQIMDGSPAQEAGLRSNDIIVSIDQNPIESSEGLTRVLYNYQFGDVVEVEFYRDGRLETLELEFKEYDLAN